MTTIRRAKLKVMKACFRRAGCFTVALALHAGGSPSMAQSVPALDAKPSAPSLTKEEVNALSGLAVTLPKRGPKSASGQTATPDRPQPLSGLTVTIPLCPPAKEYPDPEAKPPKLLSSYPANGSVVRPGIVLLRLTFDKPMACIGLLDKRQGYPNPCPAPLQEPLFSRDRRTFLTVCIVDPDLFNMPPVNTRSNNSFDGGQVGVVFGLKLDRFTSLSGQPFNPTNFEFTIDPDGRRVENLREAMAQDKFLRDAQKAAEKAQ